MCQNFESDVQSQFVRFRPEIGRRLLPDDGEAVILGPGVFCQVILSPEHIEWPSESPTGHAEELKLELGILGQDAVVCHSPCELKGTRDRIEDFQDMNAVAKNLDFVEGAIVDKLTASKQGPALDASHSPIA